MSKVAVRHNEIIGAVARHLPVLPMRLGIFFASRSSLIARLTPYEADTAEFLRRLVDRQEWAVKIYFDEGRAEKAVPLHAGPVYLTGRRIPEAARNTWLPKDCTCAATPAGPDRGQASGLDRRGPFARSCRLLVSASSAAGQSHKPAGKNGMERCIPALQRRPAFVSRGV